jgi:hypothetical protein
MIEMTGYSYQNDRDESKFIRSEKEKEKKERKKESAS